MADEVASLLVRITADGSQAVGVLNGVASTVGTLADKNATLLNKVSSVGTLAGTVGKTITKTFGVATVAGLTASAKAAGKLNKELANIGTLSVPTERLQQFKGQIQDIAIAAGKDTSDISEGTYQVISAFGDAADTMEKVEINAKAAKAGLATTADSIALTSAVTKAYGDTSAKAVQHVADLAFKTVELGQTTFPELAQSMQQVTSLSKQLGVSQEELFASYATLTGVTGNASEVQTQLKAVYNALLKPSEKMEQAIHNIGYESGYTMINTLGLAGTLDALVKATDGSDEALLSLFNNQRALPAILALTGAQADVFSEKLTKMKNASGAATKAFEVQTEGVAKTGFTLEQAKVKMQVAAQKFGESAAPLIGDVADVVDRASTALSGLTEEQRKSIINTGVMATKTGIALSAGGKAVTLGTKFVGTVKAVAPALASVGPAAGLAAAGIAGVTLAVVAGKKAYDYWYDSTYKWGESLEKPTVKLNESISSMKELNDLQWEYNDLSGKISKGELDGKELEYAKSRVQEIVKLLNEKYNLNIECDLNNLEQANKLVNDTIEKTKTQAYENFKNNKSSAGIELAQGYSDYAETSGKIGGLRSQYEADRAFVEEYSKDTQELIRAENDAETAYKNQQNAIKEYGKESESAKKATQEFTEAKENELRVQEEFNKKHGTDAPLMTYETALEKSKQQLDDLENSMKNYEALRDSYVQGGLLEFENGHTAEGLDTLRAAVEHYGASATDTAQKLASLQTGFNGVESAMKGNDLTGYLNTYISDMREFGQSTEQIASGIGDMISGIDFSKLNEGQLKQVQTALSNLKGMDNVKINVSAEGDVSILDEATGKVEAINTNSGVDIFVNADGDVSIVDEATGKMQLLQGIGAVSLQVNADGDIEVLDEAGQKIAEIDGETGEVTFTADTSEPEEYKPTDKDATVKFKKDSTEPDNYKPEDKHANVIYHVKTDGAPPQNNAKGTQNFSGGLAMVNDQKGISDPRELIIDGGRAFIPQGRNVILPLSKGAKVYTASQTKAIMSGMGIPHYAEGKDNSDAFKEARDAWTHTTKIRAVTVTEELDKWVELSGKFKDNIKDAEDIAEEIFTAARKVRDEQNEQSKNYILDRAELNDWESWGDTAVSAFDRVRERENKYVAEGKITAKEADKYLVDLGEDMYDARIANSKAWLEREEKYNNLAVEDYIAGLDRMAAYTDEYYAKGIITAKEHRISMQEIGDMKADKISEVNSAEYEAWKKDAAQYRKRAEVYGWGLDSELEYLERYKAKIQKFYNDGKISYEEYIYDYQDAHMEWYKKQSDTYDAMLKNAEEYVSKTEESLKQAKDAFEDKWSMAKLDDNIKEQTELVKLYSGAVTARGKEALKSANEKLADYRHEKAAYELEQRQAAELESIRRDYNRLEAGKKTYLAAISGSAASAEQYIKALNTIPEDMRSIMGELLTAIRNIKVQGGNTSTYGDTHYNIQMPNIEGNFIYKLNRALGGY